MRKRFLQMMDTSFLCFSPVHTVLRIRDDFLSFCSCCIVHHWSKQATKKCHAISEVAAYAHPTLGK